MPDSPGPDAEPELPAVTEDGLAATAVKDYADRLNRLQGKWWKKLLNVQLPWKLHIRRLGLGRTLDVGCGNGRNLSYLRSDSVGVDHNPYSVASARAAGGDAYTDTEFFASAELTRPGGFDSILAAHLIEHLTTDQARAVMTSYLPVLRPGGRVVFFTPQERGYRSDPTHVVFTGFAELAQLCADLELVPDRSYSFPFPRWAGKLFVYNEFIVTAVKPPAA